MLVKTENLNVAIKNSMLAKSKDENRPIFENIHIFTKDENLIIEAVDGFRLHQSVIPIEENEEKANFNILVKELKAIKDKSKFSEVELKDNVLKINSDLYMIDSEEAKNFLDSKNVIPELDNDLYFYVNPVYMIEALKNITNELDTKHRTVVKIQFTESKADNHQTISKISPIKITSGNQTNIVLPIREPNK
jgi:DNA polymerase III sliding clamp (beta) subunit (PCNA family)